VSPALPFSEALKALIYCENRVDELAHREAALTRMIEEARQHVYATDDHKREKRVVRERLCFYKRLVAYLEAQVVGFLDEFERQGPGA